MSKTALLIVDMQKNCKTNASSTDSFLSAVAYINEVSKIFRSKSLPVVIIQDLEDAGPGEEGFDCVDELIMEESDFHIHKRFSNSFWQTELDTLLRSQDVDGVVVCGFAAEYCVLFTYNGAVERGYSTFLLQHGIAGVHEEEINRIQQLRPVVSYNALGYFLK